MILKHLYKLYIKKILNKEIFIHTQSDFLNNYIYFIGGNSISRADILQKIKVKEEQLEKQLADAHIRKEQMIQAARQEAVKFLHEGEAVVEKKMAERLTQAQKALVTEKEQIMAEKSKDTELIKKHAEENFDKAIPIILEIFERSVNAETPEDE
ncbi:MAG: hypothetical protein JSV49_09825 [Thermoplasmata archaeon]|nr:MAG: hypothetical protein JSV49_09825 [Thermoplasmata archaeon]